MGFTFTLTYAKMRLQAEEEASKRYTNRKSGGELYVSKSERAFSGDRTG